jgi:acetylornithine/N-succinyldiaminopimelate aminotransferase
MNPQNNVVDLAVNLMNYVKRPEPILVRGRGSELWDEAGNRYLDFVQGWAVNALGHAPEVVLNALQHQASQLLTASPAYFNRPELTLAKRLTQISGMAHATFCSSGAEALECAIKICRKWGQLNKGGAFEILSTQNAFHGRTLAAMSLSGKPGWDALFPPNVPGFRKVLYGDVKAIEQSINGNTVAICVEPVQGEAGAVTPTPDYLKSLRELANEHHLLLIFDEVQTGMGRTGTWFAFQQAGVLPDVVTLGKGLGAGVPLSAVLVNERANVFSPGDHGGTFNGNPLMTAVGNAVLDAMEAPNFFETVRARSEKLRHGLEKLADKYGGFVRGQGLLLAFVLESPIAESLRDRCLSHGLLVNAARPDVLRFMPELHVPEVAIAEMLSILERCIVEQLARSTTPHMLQRPSSTPPQPSP